MSSNNGISIQIWDAKNLNELEKKIGNSIFILNIYSLDDNLFFVGGWWHQPCFIDLDDNKIIYEYDFLLSCSALSDNKEWICGRIESSDGTRRACCIIHVPTKKYTVIKITNDPWAKDVGFIPNKEWCYIGCDDGSISIIDCKTGNVIQRFETIFANTAGINAITVSPDIVGGWNDLPKIAMYSLADGSLAHVYEGHSKRIFRLSYSPCGKYFVSHSEDGSIAIWKLARK